MSKQIIILGTQFDPLVSTVSCVFWFPIATNAKAVGGVSVWAGASIDENQAIQDGTVVEEQRNFQFPTGSDVSLIETFLLQYWNNKMAQLKGVGPNLHADSVYDPGSGGWQVIKS